MRSYSAVIDRLDSKKNLLTEVITSLSSDDLLPFSDSFIAWLIHNQATFNTDHLSIDAINTIRSNSTIQGVPLVDHIRVLNYGRAISYICSNATKGKPLSVDMIKKLHSILTSVLLEDVDSGEFRFSSSVRRYHYKNLPDWQTVPPLLHALVDSLEMNRRDGGHPVLLASRAFVTLDWMQPFVFNTRDVSIFVANYILMQGGYLPLSYSSSKESDFEDALVLAHNSGDRNNVIKLIAESNESSLDYLSALRDKQQNYTN